MLECLQAVRSYGEAGHSYDFARATNTQMGTFFSVNRDQCLAGMRRLPGWFTCGAKFKSLIHSGDCQTFVWHVIHLIK